MPKLFFTCVSSSEPVQGPTAIMGVYVNLGTLLLIPMAQPVQGPTASMGIYVNSGSIYESPRFSGSSALLECLAFKSTTHRSATRITSEVQCHRVLTVLGGRRSSRIQGTSPCRSYDWPLFYARMSKGALSHLSGWPLVPINGHDFGSH